MEVVNIAYKILNFRSIRSKLDKILCEIFYSTKLDISRLYIFRAIIYIYKINSTKSKLDARFHKYINLSLNDQIKDYYYDNIITRKLIISNNVYFIKNVGPTHIKILPIF